MRKTTTHSVRFPGADLIRVKPRKIRAICIKVVPRARAQIRITRADLTWCLSCGAPESHPEPECLRCRKASS